MSVDWTKPIQTRDGKPARLLGVLRGLEHLGEVCAHVVAVQNNGEYMTSRYATGSLIRLSEQAGDIINVPPPPRKFVRWVNLYEDDTTFFHDTRKAANIAGAGRIGCRRVELAEGFDDETV